MSVLQCPDIGLVALLGALEVPILLGTWTATANHHAAQILHGELCACAAH